MVINVTTDKIKEMMDACYMAKRVRDLLPELPKGVAPIIHPLFRHHPEAGKPECQGQGI